MDIGSFPDPVVVLEAVDLQQQADATKELVDLAKELFAGQPHPLSVIVITDDFTGAVDRLRRNFGAADPATPPYNQNRSHVVAVAKTIPCKIGNKLGFAIVVDASAFAPECFQKWSADARLQRRYFLIHEIVHIADMWAEASAIGIDNYMNSEHASRDRIVSNAVAIWQEYHAVRFTTEALAPWSHHVAQETGYNDTLRQLLEGLPVFLRQRIIQFRIRLLTADDYLSQTMPRLNQLLTVWAYVMAMEDAGVHFSDAHRQPRAYNMVLALADPLVRSTLWELYRDQWQYQRELLTELGNVLDMILEKLGVRFQTLADGGTYAHILDLDI